MEYIDLSHPLIDQMPTYPGDAPVTLKPLINEGISNHLLSCTMHVGTHIDAPGHMLPGGKKLSEFPLSSFIGKGVLLDARGKAKIGADVLSGYSLERDSIVLIYTGFGERFHEKDYFTSYPALDEGFAEAVISAGVKLIGTDTCSPDYAPHVIHKLLMAHDILIAENLTNLNTLIGCQFEVIALPLSVEADGALARIIARKLC